MFNKVHDGGLTVLGGAYELSDNVSWVPRGSTGYQASNCYLLSEGDAHLLIDSGMAVHGTTVLDDLATLIGEGGGVSMFFTRPEMDCVSNLEPIARRFDILRLFTGGVINPFDAFDDVSRIALRGRRQQIDGTRTVEGDALERAMSIEVAPGRILDVQSPLLRLLPTFWGWDARTGTLFTSDTFTHGVLATPESYRFIDDTVEDDTTVEQVAAHLFAKYEWLPRATKYPLRDWLASTFEGYEPEAIAPSRGSVIRGRDAVRRHLDLMLAALADDAA
ncbi:hypothetical protein GCM10017596_27850 [Microbacterium keratanolyticum]|uniref:Uncharacterized protein n=2 Tax=Microbacterium keratanolyticum TaxID=67574 RepID=A0A9W6HVH2_9MICO|nr:hypothetical protein [Microbacterium keratanolyticum]GLK03070.1 hypothetical protein GCM10017596_27850 [Microbacterium keratanolyticum]